MRLPAWYQLRATRAQPPGLAAEATSRAAIYQAALQQAEELVRAAMSLGPASRPLPLYYAISQAGRAIVAARGSVVEAPPRHGLRLSTVATRILETAVEPEPRGQFPTVAEAVESTGLTEPVQVGALMATIPELAILPELGDRWRRALPVWRREATTRFDEIAAETLVPAAIVFPNLPADRQGIESALASYPTAVRLISQSEGAHRDRTPDGVGVLMHWPRGQAKQDPLPPPYGPEGRRWLRPAVCGTDFPPSLLMAWWAVLYGLSMLARYHPVEWVSALDLDRSSAAVPLEMTMEVALEVVPQLVLEAIMAAPDSERSRDGA